MNNEDGPLVVKTFYEKLLAEDKITVDAVPYPLDHAVAESL
jgi:hypothetical protein